MLKECIKFSSIFAAVSLLAGCASPDMYKPPSATNTQGTIVKGFSLRKGSFLSADWINAHVISLDNKSISYPFFSDDYSSYKIPVTPNQPHHITITSQFNHGFSDDGPYGATGTVIATFAPGREYTVNAVVNNGKVNMWIQTQNGKKASSVASAPYQILPKDETIIISN